VSTLLLTCFRSGLPRAVDGDFDGLVVGGNLRRTGGDHDGERETLPCNREKIEIELERGPSEAARRGSVRAG
jgi:hypothetical protein